MVGKKKNKMKKVNRKDIRNFLIILLVAQVINLALFKGLEIGSHKLGEYIYSITAKSFLAQTPITHKDLSYGNTIKKLTK